MVIIVTIVTLTMATIVTIVSNVTIVTIAKKTLSSVCLLLSRWLLQSHFYMSNVIVSNVAIIISIE